LKPNVESKEEETMSNTTELPLDEQLEGDTQGAKAREMVALLGRSQQLVRARLRGQCPAAEFKAAEQLALALDASERVIRSVWESHHGRRLH
jgi:hypothetical protein